MEVTRLLQAREDLTKTLFEEDCSAGACERNWSAYSLIHTKIRNRLSTTQLERLVFCRANLRLFWNFSSLVGPKQRYLDDQFTQLQTLQDASNPNFVGEVISLFLDDSERLLTDLTRSLEQEQVDFRNVDAYVHRFKGSSASVGAQRVKEGCIEFRNLTEEENIDGCRKALGSIKQEFNLVKNHLQTLLQLEQNILAAGGIIPMTD